MGRRLAVAVGILLAGAMPLPVTAQSPALSAPQGTELTLAELQQLIAEEYKVPAERISLDTHLKRDLGGDDLNLTFVIMRIDETHALMVPDDQINGIETVRDILYAANSPAASLKNPATAQSQQVEPSDDLLKDIRSLYFVGAHDRAVEELAACQSARPSQCLKLLEARSIASLEVMRASGGEAAEAESDARTLLAAVPPGFTEYRTFGVTAHYDLGVALTEQGRLKEGEEHLRETVRLLLDPNTKDHWQPFTKGRTATPYVALRRASLDLARNLGLQERYATAIMAFSMANNEANHGAYGVYNREGGVDRDGGTPNTRSTRRDIVDDYTEYGGVLSVLEQGSAGDVHSVWNKADGDADFYFKLAYENAADLPSEAGDYRAILDAEYGIHLARTGRAREALEFLEAARSSLPFGPSRLGRISLAHGQSLIALDREAEALPFLRTAVYALSKVLPVESGDRIAAHWELGKLLMATGDRAGAASELDLSVKGAAGNSFQSNDPEEVTRLLRRYSDLFALSVEARGAGTGLTPQPADTFRNAQLAGASETAAALAQVAAAMADATGAMASLEAQRRDLLHQRQDADYQLFTTASQLGAGYTVNESQLATRYNTLSRQLSETEKEMAAKDPAYFDLIRPEPIELSIVQKLLRPDEALLFMLVGSGGTTTFAVTADGAVSSFAAGLGESTLAEQVKKLRGELQGDLEGGSRGLERENAGVKSAFDTNAASALYRSLLQPVESLLAGKSRILVATTGALGSLPLQVLPAELPDGGAPVYFGEKYSLATLPAVSSLRSLRCFRGDRARPAACGPVTAPKQQAAANGYALAAVGAPTLLGAPAANRGAPSYTSAFNGELADTAFLRKLPYLPGTLREIERIKAEFAEDAVLVRTGDAARESFVRTDPGIASALIVVLSTHGLLQSESGAIGEPGLVFTPPADGQATAQDDGLLTASEAAQMHLAADLLVLSACNTASSDGKVGAEGLSGLAKAFLYAGANALLVSHWPVDDQAGAEIVSEFLRLTKGGELDRATALRQATEKVRGQTKWSSPAYWAPFVLVGLPD